MPENEIARLENLRSYRILDTPPEQVFDDLAGLAAYICETPIALIGFMDLDRQWFKSRIGWDLAEVQRDLSFCNHTMLSSDVLVVDDALEDVRLRTCALATHHGLRFYAGVPLTSAEGHTLGTLCVMDSVPRGLTGGQTAALRKLSCQVISHLDARRQSASRMPLPTVLARTLESEATGRASFQSDELYRAISDSAFDAIIVIDEDRKIVFLNPAAETIFGYQRDELLGQSLTILMPDHLRPGHQQALQKYLETADGQLPWKSVELPGRDRNGREIAFEICLGRFLLGGKRFFSVICRDVTQRRQIEHERYQLAEIVDSSEDAIISQDRDGVITSWNKGAARIYGYLAEEVLCKPVSILAPVEHHQEIAQILESLKGGESTENHETVGMTKSGDRIHISLTVSPLRDRFGRIVGASSIGRDISRSKRAEKALRDSEQRLEGIINSAMDAIITVDSDQRILVFNKAAEQIFGYSASEAMGQLIDKFLPQRSREKHRLDIQRFGRTGVTGRSMYSPGTLYAVRANGQEFPIEATISQVEAGGHKLFTVILRDVSARARMEEELRQSQKIEAIGQLAGGIAHEFNNFLGIILGYSELLSEEAVENESLRRKVAEIELATQKAASLTRQLLAFSRKSVLEPKVLDLNQEIWETHKLLRRLVPTNVDIVPALDPAIEQIRADPGQIQQILINLVVNARDAMPAGGKVLIETANVVVDEEQARQYVDLKQGSYVTLSVSDNGSGMSPETRARIFEPFFTTKEIGKGTGLGLSTIYGIVKQSGGHVAVESEAGKGTTFRIYLPVSEETGKQANGPSSSSGKETGGEAVMVVEDETSLRHLLTVSLERHGYQVFAVKDGAEAIEFFRKQGDQVRLVVSDIMMPRVDGFALKERLTAMRPDLKFLLISGYSEEILQRSTPLSETCVFLEKPFLTRELVSKVQELLRGAAAA